MDNKLYWAAVLDLKIRVDGAYKQDVCEIHISGCAGEITLELYFPNVWEWEQRVHWGDDSFYYVAPQNAKHLRLKRKHETVEAAIEEASSFIESSEALLDIVGAMTGKDISDFSEGFRDFTSEYAYEATTLDALTFITGVESSGDQEREITLDWGAAIRELPRDQWVNHRHFFLTFITEVPFRYGHWRHWKWLFKQLDAEFDPEFAAALLSRIDDYKRSYDHDYDELYGIDDTHLSLGPCLGRMPTHRTIFYLRRRGRRYMRELARLAPELYMDIAKKLLSDAYGFDSTRQWIRADILYGATGRWANRSHGRGRLFPQNSPFSTDIREERLPDRWDKEIPFLEACYKETNSPWQITEFAAKILKDIGIDLPAVEQGVLDKFMLSSSATLMDIVFTRYLDNGGALHELEPDLVAFACVIADPSLRSRLEFLLLQDSYKEEVKAWPRWRMSKTPIWLENEVLKKPANSFNQCNIDNNLVYFYIDSHIQQIVAMLLLKSFNDSISLDGIIMAIECLPDDIERDTLDLILKAISRWDVKGRIDLICVPRSSAWSLRKLLMDGLEEEIKKYWDKVRANTLKWGRSEDDHWRRMTSPLLILLGSEEDELRGLCWELALLDSEKVELVRAVWRYRLAEVNGYRPEDIPVESFVNLGQTLASLIQTGNIDLLYKVGGGHPVLSGSSIVFLLQHAPADESHELASFLSKYQWAETVSELRRLLDETIDSSVLLNGAWLLLGVTEVEEQLVALVKDERFLEYLFKYLPTPDLATMSPLQIYVVEVWLEKYPQRFLIDTDLLYKVASNQEPRIHRPAIMLAVNSGMSPELALRLLESGLPACLEAGQEFFNSLPLGDAQETEYALILCDSPKGQVQEAGLEFIKERWSTLPITRVLGALAEHRSSHIQAFVAEQLTENNIPADKLLEFDSHVLLERNRGRRAKEKVKERLGKGAGQKGQEDSAQPAAIPKADDVERLPVLVETARGSVMKDSDWALALLVQASLDGEDVDGLTIDGPVGV